MADNQNYAFGDGTVGECPGWNAPSVDQQKKILESAFSGLTNQNYSWINSSDKIKTVKLQTFHDADSTIKFALRTVSGGGRPKNRPDELRIQIDPATINELRDINQSGGVALIIGVYCVDDVAALALWRPLDGSAGAGSSSKQIDAHVVAEALVDGISSYVYPDGEIVYAVLPELFRGYLSHLMPNKITEVPKEVVAGVGELSRPRNLIYFGAPGTGKSFQLNSDALGTESSKGLFSPLNVSRVTFHPDYTYAQFIGCFKPYSEPHEDRIETGYRFISGPFLKTYIKACLHPEENYLLIIEELNRANPAAVFGDIFQLLDRDSTGCSRYKISVPYEMKSTLLESIRELSDEERDSCELNIEEFSSFLSLPKNMYIWATMNSADQGVYPMDTAFKRRWDFSYIGINEKEAELPSVNLILGEDGHGMTWNDLRKGINKLLLDNRVNEDKLLGPFFIDPAEIVDNDAFLATFKNKVLLYLFEDAAKTKRGKIFSTDEVTYSSVCLDFDKKGEGVFQNFPYQSDKSSSLIDIVGLG